MKNQWHEKNRVIPFLSRYNKTNDKYGEPSAEACIEWFHNIHPRPLFLKRLIQKIC